MSVIPEPSQASEPVPDASAHGEAPSRAGEPVPEVSVDGGDQSEVSEPVPDASVGGEDLLGLRIGAALIDLALLLVLFVVLAVLVGEAIVGGVAYAFSFSLDGAGFALYVALALLYYFVLEAAIGQTVGKLLLGLRVVRAGGGRPNVLHVAARTLVRVVDWLPAFYLVGFIAMLATGVRRRRLGDLAADTRIARAVPMRHRGLAAAGLASFLVLVLAGSVVYVAASDQDEGAQTYRGNGVSFDYPAGWEEGTTETFAETGNADELWEVAFVLDGWSLVTVGASRMNMPVTAENLDAVKPEFEKLVRGFFEQQLGGTVQSGPEEITVAGRPGLRFRGTGTLEGTSIESTFVSVFDGTTQYTLNCQHTPEWAEEIERGCEQIVRTFTVDEVETQSTVPPAAETPAPTQGQETAAPGAGEVDVFDLEVGDCLAEIQDTEEIVSLPTVPCSEPHSEEVYAAVTLPEGDFPGEEAVAAQADELCTAEFESFVGLPYEESVLYYNYLYPSDEQSWNSGYREVVCSVYDPAGEVSGSLRGVER
jgi:uncharacterized RDD family membrane protein YckC